MNKPSKGTKRLYQIFILLISSDLLLMGFQEVNHFQFNPKIVQTHAAVMSESAKTGEKDQRKLMDNRAVLGDWEIVVRDNQVLTIEQGTTLEIEENIKCLLLEVMIKNTSPAVKPFDISFFALKDLGSAAYGICTECYTALNKPIPGLTRMSPGEHIIVYLPFKVVETKPYRLMIKRSSVYPNYEGCIVLNPKESNCED